MCGDLRRGGSAIDTTCQSVDHRARDERLSNLAVRYRQPLVRYFLRRGLSPETAEDCAQEVFLRVTRVDRDLLDSPDGYLFKIAASVVVDHTRWSRSRREAKHDPIDELIPAGAASPARILEGRQALEQLAGVLDELPERSREMFLLNRLDGLSYTQLAARYRLSVKAIEKQMSKVLLHLRQRYESHD